MKNRILPIIGLLCISNLSGSTQKNLKTSLIIPCIPVHALYLYPLLNIYETQTVLPDEVVISLSEADAVEPAILETLEAQSWHFPILLVLSKEKLYAGENRNRACEHATGDIFICQDADDLPHPQRIEIIKYFFEHHQIDHLVHEFTFGHRLIRSITFPSYSNFDHIDFFYNEAITFEWKNGRPLSPGNPAITREVFNKVKWPSAARCQDVMFNEEVYKQFNHCYAIKIPLLVYRQFLSSLSKDFPKRRHEKISIQEVITHIKPKTHKLIIIKNN